MFVTQYTHRLPADYAMERIRERAALRGPGWDNVPGLILKGFLVRERGKFGALSNIYSSLYLWQDADAFATMIAGDRFQSVIDAFGRPKIETFIVLASAFGPADAARFARRIDAQIPPDEDLSQLVQQEVTATVENAGTSGVLAVVSALDVGHWRLSRFAFSAQHTQAGDTNGTSYEIAYLARPETKASL